jgi:hypothetical protein
VNGGREAAQAASRPREPRRESTLPKAEAAHRDRDAALGAREAGTPCRGAREPRARGRAAGARTARRGGAREPRRGPRARGPGVAHEGLQGGAHAGEKKRTRAGKGRGGRGRGRERRREGRGAHLGDPNSGDHRLQNLGHHGERERGGRGGGCCAG